jgi:hypothetical protein
MFSEGESWCAVSAIFFCYGDYQCNDIAIVKAGVISAKQLKTPMVLFSNGALINPHLPNQLTHFAQSYCKSKSETKIL